MPKAGELLYFLARTLRATRVVEFATSFGISTIYLAAAERDNDGGVVIGSEIVASKAERATENLSDAGLAQFAEIRVGDTRETLTNVDGAVDIALIDGWPSDERPAIAREVVEILAPQLRLGALMVNDNGEPDYLHYIRDPAHGFQSLTLEFERPTEIFLKII